MTEQEEKVQIALGIHPDYCICGTELVWGGERLRGSCDNCHVKKIKRIADEHIFNS